MKRTRIQNGCLLLALFVLASSRATAGEVLKATFDAGTTGRGMGLNAHVTSRCDDPFEFEPCPFRYEPTTSRDFGLYSAFWIDPAAGLGGSAKGLHMVRDKSPMGPILVDLLADDQQNPSTKNNPYWIDYRFRWGQIESSTDGQFFVYSHQCSSSTGCGHGALLWQATMTARKPTPKDSLTLAYYIVQPGPYPHAYLGDVLDAEYRVVMKIDPGTQEQTHWVFRDGIQLSDPILGKPWHLANDLANVDQTEQVESIRFLGHYDTPDSSELNIDIDEVRISTDGPAFLKAYPAAVGQVNLVWTDNSINESGYRIERSLDGQTWNRIDCNPEESDCDADVTSSNDTSVTEKTRYYYRVGAVYGSDVVWSNTAYAVAIYTGGPLSDWIDVTDRTKIDCGNCPGLQCPALGDGNADNTCAIQQYLNLLNYSTHPDDPHVLYFPSGTYKISQTLFLANTEGAELVGEGVPSVGSLEGQGSPGPLEATGGAIIKWEGVGGTKSHTTGEVSAEAVLRLVNNHNMIVRNLVFDGGRPDAEHENYVVGLDMSACDPDNTDTGDNQNVSCPPDLGNDWFDLTLPLGRSNFGSEVFDSVFQNAWIGFRISNKSYQDSDMSTRRSRFLNNEFGVSIEDFNALQVHFWDCQWDNNRARGITNYIKNFGGAPENFAGEFAIDRGRFSNNGHDIYYTPTGQFRVRDSWSKGSGMFIYGQGENGNVPQITISNNVVKDISPSKMLDDYDSNANPNPPPDYCPDPCRSRGDPRRGRTIANLNPGPLVMFDNKFGPPDPSDPLVNPSLPLPPIYSYTTAFGSSILALSNQYAATVPYEQSANLKLRAYDDVTGQSLDLDDPPALPVPNDILDGHKVFTVTDAGSARDVIAAAVSAAQTSPVVIHFLRNKYFINATLAIPAVPHDLVVTGSGAATTLEWNGKVADTGPMMAIGGYHTRTTVRDLTFNATSADGLLRSNGLVIDDVNADSTRVFMNAIRTVNPRALFDTPSPGTPGPGTGGIDVHHADRTKLDIFGHLHFGYLTYLNSHRIPPSGGESGGTDPTYPPDYDDFMMRVTAGPQPQAKENYWSGDCLGATWCFLGVNGPQGLNWMISGMYMEHAKFFLNVEGPGGPGNVTVSEARAVTSRTTDPTAILVNDFPGNVSVISTWLYDFDPMPFHPPPRPIPTGALIAQTGDSPVTIESMGNHWFTDPGYEVTSNATFVRNSDKLHLCPADGPDGTPDVCPDATYTYEGRHLTMHECRTYTEIPGGDAVLGDPTVGCERSIDLVDIGEFGSEGSPGREALTDGLAQIRGTCVPGFYDEPSEQETYQVNVDNVKINHAITGILVNGGIPADPSGLSAEVTSDPQVDLSWDDYSTSVDGFTVRRATSSGGTFSDYVGSTGADGTSFSDTNVSEGNQFWYSVTAYRNTTGESGAATTGPVSIPLEHPTGQWATPLPQRHNILTWTDMSQTELGYEVWRAQKQGNCWGANVIYNQIGTTQASSGTELTVTYDDNTGVANVYYCYRVRAYNGTEAPNYSPYVNTLSIKTTQ